MARLVSISGAQSTGKSTLLEALKEVDGYYVDDFKVSRATLEKIGKPLYEINQNEKETINYQKLILEAKIEHDQKLKEMDCQYVFVERCTADIFAYAKTWKGNFPDGSEYSNWFDLEYSRECEKAMNLYDIAIFIPTGAFPHVDDGVRARADSQETVSGRIDVFLARHWMKRNFAKPIFHLHRLLTCDTIDRVQEIKYSLEDAEKYFNYYVRRMSDL